MTALSQKLKSALIVDDDRIMCGVATAFLQKRADEVLVVKNGKEALELLHDRDNDIDFILCDLQMPELDGIQFLRHLKICHYKGPITLLSGVDQSLLALAQNVAESYDLDVIGALEKPLNVKELDALLERAFEKKPGKPKTAFSDLGPEDLARAIEQGQITVYYQPQVDMRTNRIVGAEALVRWAHPELGLILPDHFIPMAEKHGLMNRLSETVLKIVARDAKRCCDLKSDFRTSINLSASAIADVKFPDRFSFMVQSCSMDISKLTLEITESKLLLTAPETMEVLARLRLLGFELSIDGFGTEHSNMEHLRDFPFSELKIDRSFVTGAHNHQRASIIIEACVQLCRKYGIRCVAEGVETEKDLSFVGRKGVDVAQGYFMARPMPIEATLKWIKDYKNEPKKEQPVYSTTR